MALMETLTVNLGAAVAKSVIKAWLKDDELAQAASASLVDTLSKHIPDFLARRRTAHQFDRIADTIAETLAPLIEAEFPLIDDGERISAILAVSQALDTSVISAKFLIEDNIDPLIFEERVRRNFDNKEHHLSADATNLFNIVLRECCNYIVEISSSLPKFSLATTREILKREDELLNIARKVIDELPKLASGRADHETEADRSFEIQYRREVARKLDNVELFGITISDSCRRYPLSVAYITLDLQEKGGNTAKILPIISGDADEQPGVVRATEALAASRCLLIKGQAGSGKTTLLQWVAIKAARSAFEGTLEEWNGKLPFFIELRRHVGGEMPPPERFVDHIAKSISGAMPLGWVHRRLDEGALVLVDGVDELPEAQRGKTLKWLEDLQANFQNAVFLLTSRPPTVDDESCGKWFIENSYKIYELLPMDTSDVEAFIDHWHDAACLTAGNEQTHQIKHFGEKLKQIILDNRPIRSLASSPLLCAMLCALNKDRRTQLPRNRMELYKIALEMLLDRRDQEREVFADQIPDLSTTEKSVLLQDLALWLIKNGYSDAPEDEVSSIIARKLRFMHNIRATAPRVLRHLLIRSGLLRQPVSGRIDFIHKTFQEYLAAKEVIEENSIGMLIEHSHLDLWHEVIVLAAGHAQKAQREALLQGLIERGEREPRNRYKIHLLAVASLETCVELSPETQNSLRACLDALVPPKNMSDAKALASAGDLAVPLMRRYKASRATVAAACVRTLALVGSEDALGALTLFGADGRVVVQRELIRAWPYFDVSQYAERVLASLPLENGRLLLKDLNLIPATKHLSKLSHLHIEISGKIKDLSILLEGKNLRSIAISNSLIENIAPLGECKSIFGANFTSCSRLSDISPLSKLPDLTTLFLFDCAKIADLDALSNSKLRRLYVSKCKLTSLDAIGEMEELHIVTLSAPGLEIPSLERLKKLGEIEIRNSVCKDLAWLPSSDILERVSLSNAANLSDISALEKLPNLKRLDLTSCEAVADMSVFSRAKKIARLTITGHSGIQNLKFLKECPNIRTLNLSSCPGLTSLDGIEELKGIYNINVSYCRNLRDISAIRSMKSLRFIDARGCTAIEGREIFNTLPKLMRVT
jgi:Leucine-rich repeat (LRR) protein